MNLLSSANNWKPALPRTFLPPITRQLLPQGPLHEQPQTKRHGRHLWGLP